MPSPTFWSDTSYVSLTYSQNIDALLGGVRWSSLIITYSFPGYGSMWSTDITTGYGPSSGSGQPWSASFAPLSAPGFGDDQTYFADALRKWANVANMQFSLVADTSTNVGDIRAAYTPLSTGFQASAYYPGNSSVAGDIWFNSNGTSAILNWTPGSYENFTILHELGHALGLKHPFEMGGLSSTVLPSSWDTQSYTIMSYSAQPGDITSSTIFSFYPTTPMILDIQAIQYVYGANNSYHAGDDTYLYSDLTYYHETIWDAGGSDTIQYSGVLNSTIDLRAGYGSDIGLNVYVQSTNNSANLQIVNNVWIAYGVTIENVIGGSGNDILTGNDANNSLDGGAGNDTLYGGAGNDIFDWNASNRTGNDVFYGGVGNDVYVLDTVNDSVVEYAGEGTDTIFVDFSFSLNSFTYVEELDAFGSNGVILTGNSANNTIHGASGNDVLDGGIGVDIMNGGDGNDIYLVDSSLDTIVDTTGVDTAQTTLSTFTLDSFLENLTLAGSASYQVGLGNYVNNLINGSANNDRIFGGQGNDTLTGGVGQDVMEGGAGLDTFVFQSVNDTFNLTMDRILDFTSGQDKIDLSGIDANSVFTGDQLFNFVGDSAFSYTAGELRYSDWILGGDVNGDGFADFSIKLVGLENLIPNNFVL